MAEADEKGEKKGKGWRTEIIVALIGLAGVTGTALIANWERVFPPQIATIPVVEPDVRPTDGETRLAAPVPKEAKCDKTISRPPADRLLLVGWEPVPGAATYTVEYDCFGCREYGRNWHSLAAGFPWHIARGIGLRTPIYSSAIHVQLAEDGGLALRWRVWAVDHAGVDGIKSTWCKLTFGG